MNKGIATLYAIAQKKERILIGLMSGTSLDGLDIALCKCTGNGYETDIALLQFETMPYENSFLQQLQKSCFVPNISLEQLTLLNKQIALEHAAMVQQFLAKYHINKTRVDAIASHGQTIYHAPAIQHENKVGNATLQLGDGDIIAVKTGMITISDFRQKHIAAGGAGAPLVTYGDILLTGHILEDVILLNIGGIANFTYISANKKNITFSDAGPGNTLMNQWMQQHYHQNYDADGAVAAKGIVNKKLLNYWLQHSFFAADFPKTTGPETFNCSFIEDAVNALQLYISNDDVMATLNYLTAKSIAIAVNNIANQKAAKIYVSGGGVHNRLLMQHLQTIMPQHTILPSDEIGIHAAAKEAMLFALLANETLAGNPNIFENIHTNLPAISMGKISLPY
ncbi:anhydro-N-acetylmuramic acid kinase [Ferruginibacter yonginensis]|uniref:Anhydro-N-acetylmuramic acid kinase n=1 Tax=Ferruginibacter yonginensis TaxID=1310416 RepID=A0ABV8QVI1_9BACT